MKDFTEAGSSSRCQENGLHLPAQGVNQGVNFNQTVYTSDNVIKNKNLHKLDVWLAVREGVNLIGISKMALFKQIKKGKYTTRQVRMNGGLGYEILLSSLPMEAQIKYYKQKGCFGAVSLPVIAEIPQYEAPQKIRFDEKDEQIGLLRYALVKLYNETTAFQKDKVKSKLEFMDRYNQGAFPDIFETLGQVTYKTIESWDRESRGKDYTSLIPRYKNAGRYRTVDAKESEILLKYFLQPNKLKLSEAIRLAKKDLQIAVNSRDETFRRYLLDWREKNFDLYTIAISGEKGFNDKVLPYISRDFDKIEVGDTLVADGKTFNFLMLDPVTGRPKRMTLILFYDFKSSVPVGYDIMRTENVRVIASALRRSILNLGFKPKVIYLDNGRAFRSRYFNGTKDFQGSILPGLFEKLGIYTMFAEPYHGQSKTVERFFGILGEFERRLPTYTGYNIDNKPARMHRNEKLHKRLYDSQPLPLDWVITNLELFFEEYNNREHQDGFFKGSKPIDVFQESVEKVRLQEDFAKRTIDKNELEYLMLSEADRNITRNGIQFRGDYYFSEELLQYREKVTIKYDLFNKKEILVFDKNGVFICKAQTRELVHPAARLLGSEEDIKELDAQLQMKKRLIKGVKEDLIGIQGGFRPLLLNEHNEEVKPEKTKQIKEKTLQDEAWALTRKIMEV